MSRTWLRRSIVPPDSASNYLPVCVQLDMTTLGYSRLGISTCVCAARHDLSTSGIYAQ